MVPADRAGRRYLRYAFRERCVAMLTDVVRRNRTIQVNTVIMQALVKLRQIPSAHKEPGCQTQRLPPLDPQVKAPRLWWGQEGENPDSGWYKAGLQY